MLYNRFNQRRTNHDVIVQALSLYLTEHSSDADSSAQATCHEVRRILADMGASKHMNKTGLPSHILRRRLNHEMLRITLMCVLQYHDSGGSLSIGHNGHALTGNEALEQQNRMYSRRLSRGQINSVLRKLEVAYLLTLPNRRLAQADQLLDRYSPAEMLHLMIAREGNPLKYQHQKQQYLEDKHKLNQGRPDHVHEYYNGSVINALLHERKLKSHGTQKHLGD